MRPGSAPSSDGRPSWPPSSRRWPGMARSGCCSFMDPAVSARPPCCISSAFARSEHSRPVVALRRARHRLQPRQFPWGFEHCQRTHRHGRDADRLCCWSMATTGWPRWTTGSGGVPALAARRLRGRPGQPGATRRALAHRPGLARAGHRALARPAERPGERRTADRFAVPADLHPRLTALGRGHPLTLALLADSAATAVRAGRPRRRPGSGRGAGRADGRRGARRGARAGVRAVRDGLVDHRGPARPRVGDRAGEVWSWLASRPFITRGSDGLYPHDLVRDVLEADLRRRSPETYRTGAPHRPPPGDRRTARRRHRPARTVGPSEAVPAPAVPAVRIVLGAAGTWRGRRDARPDQPITPRSLDLVGRFDGAANARSPRTGSRRNRRTCPWSAPRTGIAGFVLQVVYPSRPGADRRRSGRPDGDRGGHRDLAGPPRRADQHRSIPRRPAGLSARRLRGADRLRRLDRHVAHPPAGLVVRRHRRPGVLGAVLRLPRPHPAGPHEHSTAGSTPCSASIGGVLPIDDWLELMSDRELTGEPGPIPADLLRPAPLSRARSSMTRSAPPCGT